jgi:hypothetical protein
MQPQKVAMEERKARKTLNHTIDLGWMIQKDNIFLSQKKRRQKTYRLRMIEHKPTIDKKGPKQSTVARFNIGNRKSSKLIFSINKLGEVAFLYTYECAQLTLSPLK